MLVTPLGIMMLVRLLQPENAPSPMLVTLSGMVMLVRLVQLLKAPFPMLVTGRSVIVSGMTTVPSEPLYLVMVIVPLLVVHVN